MNLLADYLRAWSRHNIHFGISCTPEALVEHSQQYPTLLTHHSIFTPNPEVPAGHTLTLQVRDHCLIYRFPHARQFKQHRGLINERFLNPGSLVRVLEGLPAQHIILLSIPEIFPTEGVSCSLFVDMVDRFLAALPATRRYALELNNPAWLLPDYFACLQQYDVAHVIGERAVFTANFGLAHGGEIVYAVRQAIGEGRTLYAYANGTQQLSCLMETLNDDLKQLSPIRRRINAA